MMAKSVFHDLFPEEEAAELEMRAKLLSGINKWLNKSGLTQTEAAEQLGVTQARVSEIKNGKINRFSLSMLVRLCAARWAAPRDQITEGSVTGPRGSRKSRSTGSVVGCDRFSAGT